MGMTFPLDASSRKPEIAPSLRILSGLLLVMKSSRRLALGGQAAGTYQGLRTEGKTQQLFI